MRERGRKNPAAAGQIGGYLRLSGAESQRLTDCREPASATGGPRIAMRLLLAYRE
jgi:hypothetical protein